MATYLDSDMQRESRLVLCIEEKDDKNNNNSTNIDTRLFIFWSDDTDDFQLFGKRQDICDSSFVPYAFHAQTSSDLWDFIDFVIGQNEQKKKLVNLTLYNFNNLENLSYNKINYEFFENQMDKDYELVGYDNHVLNKREFKIYIRLLRTMYNYN